MVEASASECTPHASAANRLSSKDLEHCRFMARSSVVWNVDTWQRFLLDAALLYVERDRASGTATAQDFPGDASASLAAGQRAFTSRFCIRRAGASHLDAWFSDADRLGGRPRVAAEAPLRERIGNQPTPKQAIG
jgi:hypothetical protein